jgi:hypothetical protein
MSEKICQCFGDSGLHASTYHDAKDRERCDLCGYPIRPRWRVRLLLAWYDLWIGAFVDRDSRRVYLLPLPCVGIVIEY